MRAMLKALVFAWLLAWLAPWAALERMARRWRGHDVWFGTHAEILSMIPGGLGICSRAAYYHMTLAACPLDAAFHFGSLCTHSGTEIGHRVYIGAHTMLGWASIGSDTRLADNVQLLSGAHHHALPGQPTRRTRVTIGEHCWIGAHAVVMASVGDHAVVGAGSVVTRPVAGGVTAAGNPARVLVTKDRLESTH